MNVTGIIAIGLAWLCDLAVNSSWYYFTDAI